MCLGVKEGSAEVTVLIEVRCYFLVKLPGGSPHAEIAITLCRAGDFVGSHVVVDNVSYLAGKIEECLHRSTVTMSTWCVVHKDGRVL